jgi:hypothetical protein
MAQKISQMTEQTTASMTEAGTSDFLGGYTATGGNANRKFSLSGLANYFLNKFKMTLGGSSQTVKSAIDTLNSKFRYIEGSASHSLSVPSGAFTNVASLSLPSAGTYAITGGFQWSTSIAQITVGVLKLESSEITGTTVRTNAGNGSGYNASVVLSVNSAATVYLAAYQGTGDSKNVSSVMLRAAKVG